MAHKVPVESLIGHIKSSLDVDPWAKEMAEELLKKHIPVEKEMEGGSTTWWLVCPECHGSIDSSDSFCRHCGQAVKGNEID